MAKEIPGFSYTLEASGDLSAQQFRGVVVDSNGQAAVAGAAAEIAGVLQNDPSAIDRAAQIVQTGITKMVAGAAVATGANVTTDASGRAITAIVTNPIVGVALDAAANADEIISVLLTHGTA
jgi:hypothetical protein